MADTASIHNLPKTGTGAGDRVLVFKLGSESYAFPLLKVKEVIAMTETTPVPFAPPYFKGIMNLRGQVISVLDLRLKMGQSKPAFGEETAIVILDLGTLSLGVIVDSVNSVHTIAEKELQPPPDMKLRAEGDCVLAVIKREKELILMLDVARALSVEDLTLVSPQTR